VLQGTVKGKLTIVQ